MRLYKWDNFKSIIFEMKFFKKAAIVATDTVPGIISLNKNLIYQIKNRPQKKKLIIFVSNLNQLPFKLPEDLKNLLTKFWPGKLTIIYGKNSYRMPSCEKILKLINNLGPLYSSSANISGQTPIQSIEEIDIEFKKNMNDIIVIDSAFDNQNQPSTVLNYDKKVILRKGLISEQEIEKYVTLKKRKPKNSFFSLN